MIEEISIRDLGVIASARLPLSPGFTALTGETGAGKTMVVTALGLLLGERADAAAIRADSDQASVEGRWVIDPTSAVAERVRDAGGDLDDGELLLVRTVAREGRSRAVVGGRSAPVGVLTELGDQLVVVHGQSEQIRLKSSTAQRNALDRYAGAELATVLGQYQTVFRLWQAAQGELDVLVAESDLRSREADELRVAIDEIEAADVRRGEDVELTERADRLANLEGLRLAAEGAHAVLSADDAEEGSDVVALLASAQRGLERVAEHDAQLAAIAEALAAASITLGEISTDLSGYLAGLDSDGSRELEQVEERRSQLAALVRKHGVSLDDVVDVLDTGSQRLLELDNDSTRIDELRAQVEAGQSELIELAAKVSDVRSRSAARLAAAVTDELTHLAMANAEIVVTVEDRSDYSLSGKDEVAILLQPHPGAPPRPLGKGASGGELSRVMLAIEVVIAGNDPVPTFIFDEVDAGVGGAAAIEIGKRLALLSRTAQVIVVTHLAQVAAFADNHLSVIKGDDGSVTASSVHKLEGEARIAEMARLLSGLPDSESGLAHARELIQTAHDLENAALGR
ncbi:DNA repair protein RecN [Salinibacterium sp. SWN248]|uniref:DNA repair protein RecN n=1 Tax=Salinibacterium sp. SWN248 TaxID=2792056 RepID=UPI0018CD1060|nr:DNA repair protein RecN [Salinibacterium sp. SWN248]MBH0024454.1 DNA repair protein RecN [Salinibacterium sp. SWN248]